MVNYLDGHTSCGRTIDWSIVVDPVYQLGNPAGHPWPLQGPIENTVSFRTNILALIYLVLSTIWIITSLMLIGKQYFILYFEGLTKNRDEPIEIIKINIV